MTARGNLPHLLQAPLWHVVVSRPAEHGDYIRILSGDYLDAVVDASLRGPPTTCSRTLQSLASEQATRQRVYQRSRALKDVHL